MNIRYVGLLSALFPMLVLAPMASAGGPVSPFLLAGAPRAQSVPIGNDGLATDGPDASSGSVAVIPFTNISGSAADDWIGDGIAETVMADLESLAELRVIVRDRLQAVSRGRRGAALDEGAALALGRELGARWVVTGGYQRLGDQLRITARLVDTESRLVARTVKADGTLEEIFDLQDRIATELTTDVRSTAPARTTQREPGRAGVAAVRGEGAVPAVAGRGASEGTLGTGDLGRGTVTGGIILPDIDPAGRSGPGGRGGPGRSGAGAPAAGGAVASAGILTGRPSVTIVRADEAPRIDGRLDDAVWQRTTRITEFVQQSPIEGAQATEDTDIYIAYDSTHLYFGMHAHYSDPGMVRASRVDRDRAGFGDDTISIYFDTFLDQQRAYVFSLNGYGVQGDSLMDSRGGGVAAAGAVAGAVVAVPAGAAAAGAAPACRGATRPGTRSSIRAARSWTMAGPPRWRFRSRACAIRRLGVGHIGGGSRSHGRSAARTRRSSGPRSHATSPGFCRRWGCSMG